MTSSAAYGIASHIGHVDDAGRAYVATLPGGPPLVLVDSAALIWAQARAGGTLEEITDRVADAAAVPSQDIEGDVELFLEELVAQGVLVRTDK